MQTTETNALIKKCDYDKAKDWPSFLKEKQIFNKLNDER